MLDGTTTYYGWKDIIEVMEEHVARKSSTLDVEVEKKYFERNMQGWWSSWSPKDFYDELQSKKRINIV